VAALVSWLLAESLGAYMFRSWLTSKRAGRPSAGGSKRRETGSQDTMSPVLVLGHASLALAGLISWVSFLASGQPALAWLAIGLVAPAIGLGISTVTVWTPYPVSAPRANQPAEGPRAEDGRGSPAILVTNEMLDRALADEAMTSKLVDDLVERMLAEPAPREVVGRKWRLAPVIPVLHGILALATFLLTVLAAIAASA
jgi:ABC-type anion transport system duplicated permease subunit